MLKLLFLFDKTQYYLVPLKYSFSAFIPFSGGSTFYYLCYLYSPSYITSSTFLCTSKYLTNRFYILYILNATHLCWTDTCCVLRYPMVLLPLLVILVLIPAASKVLQLFKSATKTVECTAFCITKWIPLLNTMTASRFFLLAISQFLLFLLVLKTGFRVSKIFNF